MWLWIITGLNIIINVRGFSSGSFPQSCGTLLPQHGSFSPQSTEAPFQLSFQQGNDGEPFTVSLRSMDSSFFSGFMLEAREGGSPVGTFSAVGTNPTTLLDCEGLVASAVSQGNNQPKTSFEVNWTPPPEKSLNRNIIFRATFVRTFPVFWTNVTTPLSSVSLATTATVPSTTQPTTTQSTTQPTTTQSTTQPTTTQSTTQPTTTQSTTQPTTTQSTTQPTTTQSTTQQTTTQSTTQPTTTQSTTQPTTTQSTTQQTTTQSTTQQTTTQSTTQPTTTQSTTQPTTTQSTTQSTTTTQPTTTQSTTQPTTTQSTTQQTTTQSTTQPTTTQSTTQQTTTQSTTQPTTTQSTTQPTTTPKPTGTTDLRSTTRTIEPNTTLTSTEPPTTSGAMEQNTTLSNTEPNTTAILLSSLRVKCKKPASVLMVIDSALVVVKVELTNIIRNAITNGHPSHLPERISTIVCLVLCVGMEIPALVLTIVRDSLQATLIALVCVVIALAILEILIASVPLGAGHNREDIRDLGTKVCSFIHKAFTLAFIYVGYLEIADSTDSRESWPLWVLVAYTGWILLFVIWIFIITSLQRGERGSSMDMAQRGQKKKIAAEVVVHTVSVIFIIGTIAFAIAILVGILLLPEE